MEIYNMWSSVTAFFHLQRLKVHLYLWLVVHPSFLLPNNIPVYEYTAFYLFINGWAFGLFLLTCY